jgi:WD40 repeat protein
LVSCFLVGTSTCIGTEPESASGKDEMFSSLERAVMKIEEALQQNETLDISNETFQVSADEEMMDGAQADNELRELKNFADPTYSKSKLLSAIDWRPKSQGMVAVSAVENLSFDQRACIAGQTSVAYLLLWDFRYLVTPTVLMQCPHEVLAFRFCQTNPHIIAGGTISGQVVIWDTEDYMRMKNKKKGDDDVGSADEETAEQACLPKFISNVDYSHKRPVADLFWLPPNAQINYRGQLVSDEHLDGKSHQFVTIAGDGQMLVWDTRFNQIANDELRHIGRAKHVPMEKTSSKEGGAFKTLWVPIFRAHLKRIEGVGELSICRAAYCSAPPSGETHFDVGGIGEDKVQRFDIRSHVLLATEEGDILAADISGGKSDVAGKEDEKEEENSESKEFVRWLVPDHSRPCICMQISPFFPNIILTVGDWKFHIWKIGEDKPLFVSPLSSSHLTAGAWSPTRPAVLIVACADGSMLAWDFTDSSYRPSIELKATHSRITSMEFLSGATNIRQQLLAVGDESGTLHIFEIPRNLTRPLHKEDTIMNKFLDRELMRMRYLKGVVGGASGGGDNKESAGAAFHEANVYPNTVADGKHDGDSSSEAKMLSQEDLAKEEDSFAKLEAQFIAELGLLSVELPSYAKKLGVDLAVEETKGRK